MLKTINTKSKMKNNYKFNKWFNEAWKETGGLINASTAAEILGCTRSYISFLLTEEKIKKYQYLNSKNKYVSRNEILEFRARINYETE